MNRHLHWFTVLLCGILICLLMMPVRTYADTVSSTGTTQEADSNNLDDMTAQVKITTSAKSYTVDQEVIMRVRITAADDIGAYKLELKYDTKRLEYISGAESATSGVATLSGTGYGNTVVSNITFKAKADGVTWLKLSGAAVSSEGSNRGEYTVSNEARAVTVIGQIDSEERQNNLINFGADTDLPLLAKAKGTASDTMYVIDLSQYTATEPLPWNCSKAAKDGITYLTSDGGKNYFIYLLDDEGNVLLYACNQTDGEMYPCKEVTKDGSIYYMASAYASNILPDGITEKNVRAEKLVSAIGSDGVYSICVYNGDGTISDWNGEITVADTSIKSKIKDILPVIIAIIIFCVLAIIVKSILPKYLKERRRNLEAFDDTMHFDDDDAEKLDFKDLD